MGRGQERKEGQREEGPAISGELSSEGLGEGRQELFRLTFELQDLYVMSCTLRVYSRYVHPISSGRGESLLFR